MHHVTYARLGDELPEDVKALCWECHDDVTGNPSLSLDVLPMVKELEEVASGGAKRMPGLSLAQRAATRDRDPGEDDE